MTNTAITAAMQLWNTNALTAEIEMKKHGLIRDENDGDICMQLTAQEEKQKLYHNIKHLLIHYRDLVRSVTVKQQQRVKYFGKDQYYDSFCEQMTKSLQTLVEIIDDLPKWCEQGEEYKKVLHARYIDGKELEKNVWEKLQIKRSTYFLHLTVATEKVQEMFFGDSAKELVRMLILASAGENIEKIAKKEMENNKE